MSYNATDLAVYAKSSSSLTLRHSNNTRKIEMTYNGGSGGALVVEVVVDWNVL